MVTNAYNPDCGYAWVVVAACFTINFIMAGLARVAGVLYVALIDVYGVSRENATAPFSLRFCIRNLSGPAVGVLGQRFGIRPVVLLGGLICGLGGILSALAPDVTWITAAWGGLHGIGYGMCNIIHVIAINRYFHKYKGLAIGISMTGDCVGTFLLPPVLEYLLSAYDLRGTFLIMAAVSLNVVPAAMLLKPPPWDKILPRSPAISNKGTATTNYNKRNGELGKTNEGFDVTSDDCDVKLGMNMKNHVLPTITIDESENNQVLFKNQHMVDDKINETGKMDIGSTNKSDIDFSFDCINKNNSIKDVLINDTCFIRYSTSLRITDDKMKKKRFRLIPNAFMKDRRTSATSVLSCPSHIGKFTFDSPKRSVNLCKICSESQTAVQCQYLPEVMVCSQHGKHVDVINNSQLNLQTIYPHEEVKLNGLDFNEKVIIMEIESVNHNATHASQRDVLRNFLRTNIKPIFLVISATMALYVFLFISVFTIIIDYVHDNSFPTEYGKYLIIAFSVTDLFGRIGCGVVLDRKWMTLRHFSGLTVGLMGLFVLIIPFYKCFIFWMISFSLCGFVQGGVSIMFPVLVEYYMDKNEETVAFGCLNFYGGVLVLPIPLMIGYFRDNIGSYDGVFWTVGALCIFVATVWIFEPCLVRKQKTEGESNIDESLR